MSKLIHIQVLRALAALSVAFLHAQHDAAGLAQRTGDAFVPPGRFPWTAGVDVFFVISGFIMVYTSRDLFGAAGAQRIFLARRIARIVPLYWAATTLYLAAAWLMPQLLNSDPPTLWTVLASYLFVPFARPEGPTQPIYSLGWTLNYEMFFYALFALALFLREARALVALVLALVLLAILGATFELPQPWAFWTNPIVLEFTFGVGLGWLRLKGVVLDRVTRLCLLLGGLGYLAANLISRGGGEEWMRPLAWGLPAALLVAAAALGPERPAGLSGFTRFGARVGDVSYAIYLVHPFVIRPLAEIGARAGIGGTGALWGFMIAALVGTLAVSFAVHLGFERPATAWLRRRLEPARRSRPRGPVSAAAPARDG